MITAVFILGGFVLGAGAIRVAQEAVGRLAKHRPNQNRALSLIFGSLHLFRNCTPVSREEFIAMRRRLRTAYPVLSAEMPPAPITGSVLLRHTAIDVSSMPTKKIARGIRNG